ncbi:MAG: prepilin-type N-terminal cleavage/methylation domain-containing protein [Candidatus Daviesbacteria bacterium]|nr:prepilin-type N-terminal cleavage/methylation domain-containing protein [Candidatus Daviesbacteria bacterium]
MRQRGFTLIEILVVISIIAVIATFGLSSYQTATQKARDGVRKNNLNQLSTALGIYFQNKSHYIAGYGTCTEDTPVFKNNISSLMSGNNIPKDPVTGSDYCYTGDPTGASFRLFAKLENIDSSDSNYIDCLPDYNFTLISDNLTPACPTGSNVATTPPSPQNPPAGNPPAGNPPANPPPQPAGPLRVFVTHWVNGRNISGSDGGYDLGGLSGADNKCWQAALLAGLPSETGRWKAWLSDTTTSAASRLNKNGSPYKLVDGTIIANNWQDLTDGTLQNPINKNQTGTVYTGLGSTRKNAVWTNTTPQGERNSTRISDTCNDWRAPYDLAAAEGKAEKEIIAEQYSYTSSIGNFTDKTSSWTVFILEADCYEDQLPLYCFEQIPAP